MTLSLFCGSCQSTIVPVTLLHTYGGIGPEFICQWDGYDIIAAFDRTNPRKVADFWIYLLVISAFGNVGAMWQNGGRAISIMVEFLMRAVAGARRRTVMKAPPVGFFDVKFAQFIWLWQNSNDTQRVAL